jgi:hypothetical protein
MTMKERLGASLPRVDNVEKKLGEMGGGGGGGGGEELRCCLNNFWT